MAIGDDRELGRLQRWPALDLSNVPANKPLTGSDYAFPSRLRPRHQARLCICAKDVGEVEKILFVERRDGRLDIGHYLNGARAFEFAPLDPSFQHSGWIAAADRKLQSQTAEKLGESAISPAFPPSMVDRHGLEWLASLVTTKGNTKANGGQPNATISMSP